MEQQKIGKLILTKRKEKGFTQQQLADMLGVTNKAVSKWENGKSMPDIGIIPELCKVLDISISTLLNGEEIEDEQIILRLVSIIKVLKNNVKMLCAICVGLVLCNLPNVLSEFVIISEFLETNTFQSGILNGVFAGLQLSGTCFFVAGAAGLIYSMRIKK